MPPIQQDNYYYHAGVRIYDESLETEWSEHTRRSWDAAVREARRMARRYRHINVLPVVAYWRREHGLRPGFTDAVAGAEYV